MKFKITKRLYELSTNLLFFVIPVPIAIGSGINNEHRVSRLHGYNEIE